MSVALAATSGSGLSASTNLSNPQSFTKLIWAKLASSPPSVTDLFSSQNSGFTSFTALLPSQFTAGKLSVATAPGVGNEGFASQPTWTNWNCFALTGTTAGAGSLIGYWQDNVGGGFKSNAVTGPSFTNTNDNIGKQAMSVITTVAYYMEWNFVLTPTQLQSQFFSATPLISSGLRRYLVMLASASAGTDTSGNGFNMTGGGTITDGVGLPTFPAAPPLAPMSLGGMIVQVCQ